MEKNIQVEKELEAAREELARLKAEKARLFPPNPHPLAQPDSYPANYTPEQVRLRNSLNTQIEALEEKIDRLQHRLYSK